MPVTVEQFRLILQKVPFQVRRIWVAYSGGVDSHVLLHRCATLRSELPEIAGALHIHHGISASADQWEQHCQRVCEHLDIALTVRHVDLPEGEGLEDRARRARYEAMQAVLQVGDVVALAQHQDDQAETFLLQALRGGGPRGISAMPAVAPLGQGALIRPLLEYSRQSIMKYAHAQQLQWVEDDSNQDQRFDRNYLRHEIMPALQARWPSAAKTLSRTAAHTASLMRIADELLQDELKGFTGSREHTLSVKALQSVPFAKSSLLVRALCQQQGLPMPATAQLEELLQRQLGAESDRQILVTWPGGEFRRYQDDLYVLRPLPELTGKNWQYHWDGMQTLEIPEMHGCLALKPNHGAGIRKSLVTQGLVVRPRTGGERCQPEDDNHHRELKAIFQNYQVPPWERERLPLIFHDDELLAVADIVVCQQASAAHDEEGYLVTWQSFD